MDRTKKNKLPPRVEVPHLSEGAYEVGTVRLRQRRLRRWYSLYLGTALCAILATSVLLLSGSVSEYGLGTGSFWGRGATRLGEILLSHGFFDFSGTREEENNDGPLQGITDAIGNIFWPDRNDQKEENPKPDSGESDDAPSDSPLTKEELYAFDYDSVPNGQTPVIPMNLALGSYGASYIHNSTGYDPNTAALLAGALKQTVDFEYLSASKSPMVLIVHTHATESFCEDGATYCDTTVEYARSKDTSKNMIAVGKALAEELEKQGITTLHCTVMHDEVQYKDSYRRSEESIRQYLEKYPTIRLVIDLHRDAVVQSDGDVVRPVTLHEGQAAAQLMCVVGSSYGGEECPNWEQNLSLALKLRERLNLICEDLCRPPYLKSSTYNQELAPYSLLIEAGAGGNSLEEVQRSMALLAQALRDLLPQM